MRMGTVVAKAPGQSRPERSAAVNVTAGASECRKMMAELFGPCIVLLAMKHGRAPLPVSPGLWKRLSRLGLLNDPQELESLARRLLFLGDERMLLAELRRRPTTIPPSAEKSTKQPEIETEDRPQGEVPTKAYGIKPNGY
jgi:hypothetical protein